MTSATRAVLEFGFKRDGYSSGGDGEGSSEDGSSTLGDNDGDDGDDVTMTCSETCVCGRNIKVMKITDVSSQQDPGGYFIPSGT